VASFDKTVVVTIRTALEELIERFNTRGQARFYVEHMGLSFDRYLAEHEAYVVALSALRRSLPEGVRRQFIERSLLPAYTFGAGDLVVRGDLTTNTPWRGPNSTTGKLSMRSTTCSSVGAPAYPRYRLDWESDFLFFSVREPFVSRTSSAQPVFGRIDAGERLEIVSNMPHNGVIFSDGVEADRLEFNTGAVGWISLAERRVRRVLPGQG